MVINGIRENPKHICRQRFLLRRNKPKLLSMCLHHFIMYSSTQIFFVLYAKTIPFTSQLWCLHRNTLSLSSFCSLSLWSNQHIQSTFTSLLLRHVIDGFLWGLRNEPLNLLNTWIVGGSNKNKHIFYFEKMNCKWFEILSKSEILHLTFGGLKCSSRTCVCFSIQPADDSRVTSLLCRL